MRPSYRRHVFKHNPELLLEKLSLSRLVPLQTVVLRYEIEFHYWYCVTRDRFKASADSKGSLTRVCGFSYSRALITGLLLTIPICAQQANVQYAQNFPGLIFVSRSMRHTR